MKADQTKQVDAWMWSKSSNRACHIYQPVIFLHHQIIKEYKKLLLECNCGFIFSFLHFPQQKLISRNNNIWEEKISLSKSVTAFMSVSEPLGANFNS